MLRGLTRAGIGDAGNFESFVQLAAKHGFQAVDAGGSELRDLIAARGVSGAQQFLADHAMQVGSIGLPVEWRHSDEEFRKGLTQLSADAEAARALGCYNCCTYVLPATDYNAAHFMALATRRLRQCAAILDAYGLRLGLEYVGPHHLRTEWKYPFIWDLSDTLDWIDAIHESNVGLMLDSYHWHTTGSNAEELLALTPSQIVHVHLNDAPNVPAAEARDNERLHPGDGVIDLTTFLRALQTVGYKGTVAQEILTPTPVTDPADVAIARSAAAYRKVFAAAGLA